MNKYVVVEIEAKDFDASLHPRDRHGRFIRKGVSVNLPKVGKDGVGSGKVVGTRSRGRIEVQDEGGKIHVVKADQVEVSKRQAGDYPRTRSGVPERSATRHARNRAADELYSASDHSSHDIVSDVESERAYQAHTKKIEETVAAALKAGEATDQKHTLDAGHQVWTPERAAQHKQVVDELYLDAEKVPTDGKALIAGGLGGAGKSTVLSQHMGIGKNDYFTINPDDVKEKMAELGMIPKLDGLSPMEGSALVHEESSHIANMLAQRAYADRRNVIWDITMSSLASTDRRVWEMKRSGYTQIDGVFVDIPVETSVERALARHRRGMEEYDSGQGFGGRYVPPSIIRKSASSKASSGNRAVFDELVRHDFNDWTLFDNSGEAPKKVTDSQTENRRLRKELDESVKKLRAALADDTGQESTMN